ncbi:MAG: DUF134 domain-containing protein [Bacteroidales bacterium]
MPRKTRLRKVVSPPNFKGYKPYGCQKSGKEVELFYEEYEALKLADYDLMNHKEAAVLMNVSRATFARIYESARRKMATMLVETQSMKTVYGNADLGEEWLLCARCHSRFTMPKNFDSETCPLCHSNEIEIIK